MLILVPSPLSQSSPKNPLLAEDKPLVHKCQKWIVENAKPARAAIGHFEMPLPVRKLEINELKNLSQLQIDQLLKSSTQQNPLALLSDAGCPAVADPGALVVQRAHQLGVQVFPLVGPSSIILGLMASGLNGQNFHFWGYPPVKEPERTQWIKERETESRKVDTTQIVIETPFRNQKLLEALLGSLSATTELSLASDLTGGKMNIQTKCIKSWRAAPPVLEKEPTLFLWLAR